MCIDRETALAYLGGTLTEAEADEISAHSRDCTPCRELLDRVSGAEPLDSMRRYFVRTNDSEANSFDADRVRNRLLSLWEESDDASMTLIDPNRTDSIPTWEAGERFLPVRFGDFVLLERVGRGGMGVVYKARDIGLNRIVALKMTNESEDADAERLAQRFDIEARAMARLRHVNIVSILEVGAHQKRAYFTMPYLPGGTLREWVDRQPSRSEIVAEVSKIVQAVQHAHENGVLHRDLKPSNILFTDQDDAVVVDFGLAKITEDDLHLTQAGIAMGTPAYMAPEQTDWNREDIGPATDIWALGVILYELLSGKRPFRGESKAELYEAIRSDVPASLGEVVPDIDKGLEAVVGKCLRKEPSERFQSAGELAKELDRWSAGLELRTRPDTRLERVKRWVRRHPLVTGLAVQLAVALILLLAGLYYFHPDRPLWAIHSDLEAGKPATLLGETGPPKWRRWLWTDQSFAGTRFDGVFTLQTWEKVALLELVDDCRVERYRIRADVRHNKGDHLSRVGVYFAHTSQKCENGRLDAFVQVSFNDLIDLSRLRVNPGIPIGRGNPVKFHPIVTYRKRGRDAVLRKLGPDPSRYSLNPVGVEGGDWRTMEIVVGKDSVSARLGRNTLGKASLKTIRASVRKDIEVLNKVKNEKFVKVSLPTRGSIGLYVSRASASFRNVVVSPLP